MLTDVDLVENIQTFSQTDSNNNIAVLEHPEGGEWFRSIEISEYAFLLSYVIYLVNDVGVISTRK